MAQTRLILASRSQRRASLLRHAGYLFTQRVPPFADPDQPVQSRDLDPEDLAIQLATKKALSVLKILNLQKYDRTLVLGADTICVANGGELIGQPANREQARKFILGFVKCTHQVVTGIALVSNQSNEVQDLADTTTVEFGQINSTQVEKYLESEAWRGKAGAYNLIDRQAAGWPITVRGDPATVVGLPIRILQPLLAHWSVWPDGAGRSASP